MSEKLIYLLQRLMRKTWVRCMLFSLVAVLAVGLSMMLGPYIPEDVATRLGSDAVYNLLNILSTSMLTLAIFSASTMVFSFSAVASSATPSASQLLIEDTTIQNSSHLPVDEARRKAICNAVLIGPSRTFDHDPRFGLVVMGEIATRALSPGINDPGTALEVMATSVRVLVYWVEQLRKDREPAEVEFDRVTAPGLREAGMLEDAFVPLARYGASAVEVGVTLQRALASVRRLDHPAFNQTTQALSRYAIERAAHAGLFGADVQQLRDAAVEGRRRRSHPHGPGQSGIS